MTLPLYSHGLNDLNFLNRLNLFVQMVQAAGSSRSYEVKR
jgi:hypothetical protein